MSRHTCLIFLIAFLMLLSFVSALAPITVERQLPETVKAGDTIQVKLNMKFTGETPSGIIITEFIPEGWEITSALPAFTEFEGKISWLLYGEDVKNSSIIYELKVPENFSKPELIQGSWETLNTSELISGDGILIPKQETTTNGDKDKDKNEPPPADNTLYIIAGIVIIVLAIIIAVVVIKKKK
ncbi:hypothetical protein KKG83_07455 [Candidatus Micrarchaeota archaeon]|nr:hypothetical protein [Candidatus Micrarchaeota archaeon]MBU2477276.1 hypothetical protein [Candidatus Micrarchaeota archaeon]